MRWKDLANLTNTEFNKLTRADLAKAVQQTNTTIKRRLATMGKSGIGMSPAERAIRKVNSPEGEQPIDWTTRGKNVNELRSDLARNLNFLSSETGTAAGWKSVRADTIQALSKKGVTLSDEQFDNFFDAYEKLKELDPKASLRAIKYKTMDELAGVIESGLTNAQELSQDEIDERINDIVTDIQERIDEIYKQEQAVNAEFDAGVSGLLK